MEAQAAVCPFIKPRQEFTWSVHRKLKQQMKHIKEKGLKQHHAAVDRRGIAPARYLHSSISSANYLANQPAASCFNSCRRCPSRCHPICHCRTFPRSATLLAHDLRPSKTFIRSVTKECWEGERSKLKFLPEAPDILQYTCIKRHLDGVVCIHLIVWKFDFYDTSSSHCRSAEGTPLLLD